MRSCRRSAKAAWGWPTTLTAIPYWDMTSDRTKFLINTTIAEESGAAITVVEHWQ